MRRAAMVWRTEGRRSPGRNAPDWMARPGPRPGLHSASPGDILAKLIRFFARYSDSTSTDTVDLDCAHRPPPSATVSPGIQLNLAMILFAPWFAVLSVLFWRYPRQPRGIERLAFDSTALATATAAAF